ncbi:MAG: UDP-3-O-(3-hydroxymyristoyl)glucosamine N-acyltransferase [Burkholderiales bacterium]|nr:UDP-3-O-(3-hydroxymyristoyl)glucosamine N-acyltransferase [Burkholderiales bacterium]
MGDGGLGPGPEDRLRQYGARLPRGRARQARAAEARARVRRAQRRARQAGEAGPRPAGGARARQRHHDRHRAPREGAPARRREPLVPAPATGAARGPEPAPQRGARRSAGKRDPRHQPDRRAGAVRPHPAGGGVRERQDRHHGEGHPGSRRQVKLRDIVAKLGGEAVGEVSAPITGVATLDSAGPGQIAFLANPKYRAKLATTRAAAVILGPGDRDAASIPRIVSENPYAYYAKTVALFNPPQAVRPGIHPFAQIEGSANVDATSEIGPFVVIGPGANVGAGASIGAHCVLGEGVRIGANTRLHPQVSIYSGCSIGDRCIVHSGVVIGADGFGMASEAGRWLKIPQVGAVRIGHDVEIGANTTIDRGALDDTVIEDGVKLDNQIQVGHNVVIGEHTVIAGCCGISGSVKIGKHCVIGGGVGFVGHISICDHTSISGYSFITKSITQPGTYTSGMPFMPHAEWLRNTTYVRRLYKTARSQRLDQPGEASEPDDD